MTEDTQCREFIKLFLTFVQSKLKYSEEDIKKEIENVKRWINEIDEKGLKYKLECLSRCIKYIREDIKDGKYNKKLFDQDSVPDRIKFYSWPNMKRMMSIANKNINNRNTMLNKRADVEMTLEQQIKQDKKYKLRKMFEKFMYSTVKEQDPEFYESIMNRGIDNIPDDYIHSYMRVQSNIIKIRKGTYEQN